MNTFQKTVFAVVLATAFAAVPAISHAYKICDEKGENCFEIVCPLPGDKTKLTKVEVKDTELACLKLKELAYPSPTKKEAGRKPDPSIRIEALNRVKDGCIKAGGVWDGGEGGKGSCTGPRKSGPR